MCKCNVLYYGENCEMVMKNTTFINSNFNLQTPLIVSFTVGYTLIIIIGVTIIYFCCKNSKEKNEEIELKIYQNIKIDNEYQLTNKNIYDSEANNKKRDLIGETHEEKKEEINSKKIDNSYKLISKVTDQEANIVGLFKTEEQYIKKNDEKNIDNTM